MKQFSLNGKVAIITGASKGIGKAIAEIFAEAGAQVVVSSRKQEAVDAVANELKEKGGDAIGVAANAGSLEDLANLVSKTMEHFGKIDIVVNNAATNPAYGPIVNTSSEEFDKIMNVNVKGPFELSKLALIEMKKNGGGSIINISSIGGLNPEPMLGIYSVSKAALVSLTKAMAKELGTDGVRVNVICPGLIKTKFSEALWSNEAATEKMVKRLPIARIGVPEDIAGLALFLASNASAYCTGGIYTADGGFTI